MSQESKLRTYCVMAVATLADGILLIDRGVRESVNDRFAAVTAVVQHTLLDEGDVEVPAIGSMHPAVINPAFRHQLHALLGKGSEEMAAEALSLVNLCGSGKATSEQMLQLRGHLFRLKESLKQATPVLARKAPAA